MVVLAVVWAAILWFAITPDFSKWGLWTFVLAHVLPPLTIGACWFIWRRSIKRKEAALAQSREEQARAEREAALAEARGKREEELRERRFACDCRAIAISHLVVNDALELPELDQVLFRPIAVEQAHAGNTSDNLLDGLEEAITNALRHVYAKCAAASVFPVYVVPPSSISFDEAVKRIRTIHRRLADELALPIAFTDGTPSVRYLTTGESAANTVINLFASISDLPGAVILSFDSPLLGSATENDPEYAGKPSHGAFTLLVTHPQLSAMLGQFGSRDGVESSDAMTPYWEKGPQVTEHLGLLNMLPVPLLNGLNNLPVLGRIHQGVSAQAISMGSMALTSLAQTLIGRAQVNAGMADLPAIDEADESAKNIPAPSCCWLVHNAGSTATAGGRLAAVMTAMSYFGFELHPFSAATNSIAQIGELNHATPVGMLALTMAQVAARQEPAMYAEFSHPPRLSVGFVAPVAA